MPDEFLRARTGWPKLLRQTLSCQPAAVGGTQVHEKLLQCRSVNPVWSVDDRFGDLSGSRSELVNWQHALHFIQLDRLCLRFAGLEPEKKDLMPVDSNPDNPLQNCRIVAVSHLGAKVPIELICGVVDSTLAG
ncbi:hypothetical protein ABLG96_01780 [Nakamurella sp. A5-74]|uniref:Uncharacterized protein n=1 Tax=Nakamurella sp. A5-74 TaxID=3158264 RepID=A0AAU8DQ27_9ACTN